MSNQSVTRGEFASFLTRTILPEAKPTNDVYYENSGLVPENYGSVYVYSESYEGYKSYHVFDSVYDHTRDEDYQLTRVDGFTYYEDIDWQEYFLMEYYEDANSFSISALMPSNVSAQMTLNYPIKTNSFTSKTYYDNNADERVTETYKVRDTNGIFKAGNQIYTDVIIVDVIRYSDYYQLPFTFYLVKGIGVVGLYTEVGRYELENLDINY